MTLSGPFTLTDDKVGTISCGTATSLAPNASITCTAIYTIAQADMANLKVTNVATGHGFFDTKQVDSNQATATVYRQTGVLLPTQTTCQMYAACPSSWPAMYNAFLYQVKSNMINSASPGEILYHNTIKATSVNFTLTVVESNSLNWKPMLIQDIGQAYLYNANCSKASIYTTTSTNGNVIFTIKGATSERSTILA